MNAKVSSCGLVGFPAELIQNCSREEVARSLGITLLPFDLQDVVSHHVHCDVVAFYVTNESYVGVLDIIRDFVVNVIGDSHRHFIIASPQSFSQDLAEAWNLGMHSYVPMADYLDNLLHVLNRFARTRHELDTVEHQLKEASDIALLSMSASSQQGDIVRFMEKSYQCEDYEHLGALLRETLAKMGVTSCGVIRGGNDKVYFGDPEKRIYLERLLTEQQHRGRFVDVENRTTLNFENISIMARNLPEPGSEPYRRMKDVLFSLVEGADARIKAIASMRAAAVLDRSKLNFLSVMSHELRTPMNSILGFSARLKLKKVGDTLTPRDVSALEFLALNAQRLMAMIDNVFELSRIDSDADRARQRLLVIDVLISILKKYETEALAKKLQFDVHWQDEGVYAEVDPRRLRQIVLQLLDNAVKYTQTGKVSVEISTLHRPEGEEWMQIVIRDTGIGIAATQLNELFKPFGQVDDYMARGSDGVHLGLALVNKFISDLNGEIEVHSDEGLGTVIIVRVPQFDSLHAQLATDAELS